MLAVFLFVIVLLPVIFIMINQELATSMEETYGATSKVFVVADNGVNATERFSNQTPTAFTIGGIVIIVLLVGFAIGSFLTKKEGSDSVPPPMIGGGFGG